MVSEEENRNRPWHCMIESVSSRDQAFIMKYNGLVTNVKMHRRPIVTTL